MRQSCSQRAATFVIFDKDEVEEEEEEEEEEAGASARIAHVQPFHSSVESQSSLITSKRDPRYDFKVMMRI